MGAVTCLLLTMVGGTSVDAAETMRCSHQLPPDNHIAKVIDQWAAEIETLSEHTIDVQVYGANSLVKAPRNAAAVKAGEIECAFSINSEWAGTIPLMDVTLEPFTLGNIDVLKKWNGSEAAAVLEREILRQGLKNVTWLFTATRTAVTSKGKSLIKPADFKGVKIQGLGPIPDAAFAAMGAKPVNLPDSAAYQALQHGEIDASVTSLSTAVSGKYYEVQDRVTILPLFSIFFNGYINSEWYQRLPEKSRQAIVEAGNKAALWAIDASEISAAAAPGKLKEEGMGVHVATNAEIKALKSIMQPAFADAFREATGSDGENLIKLVGKL